MKYLHTCLSIFVALIMFFSATTLTPSAINSEDDDNGFETSIVDLPGNDPDPEGEQDNVIEKIISLEPGEENAQENWYIFHDALACATEGKTLSIKLEPSGTFYVGKTNGAGSLKLHSNTIIDLNGSVLIRYNQMANFFQNSDYDDDNSNGTRYSLTQNITIKNGEIHGEENVVEGVNLCNFGHASGITIENLHLSNSSESHLIEFIGCKDCNITNCTFTGVNNAARFDSPVEALQLDICDHDSSGKAWNGVYCSTVESGDYTACKNITVDNCRFINFPAAFGNHKGIQNVVTDNVRFTNCKISTNISSPWAAIWAYDFKNCEFSKNTINGKYKNGIQISGSDNITLDKNDITTNGSCVYVTVAPSTYVKHSNGRMVNVYSKNCNIKNNKLTDNGNNKLGVICVYSGSHVSNISNNTIKATYEMGISISSKSKADLISKNTLSAPKTIGLHLSASTIKKITGNNISAKDSAIQMTSGASVSELSSNTLNSTTQNTLHITSSKATLIKSNSFKKCSHDTIAVVASSGVKEISSNSIASSGENGIRVSSSTVNNILSNNINSSTNNAIYVSSKAKTTNIKNNCIKTAKAHGIYITSATASTINGNYCYNCKSGGIKVSSSGKTTCVFGNAVHASKDFGICLNNKSATVKIGNNALRGNSKSGIKNAGKTKKANKAGFQKVCSYTYYFNSKGSTSKGFKKIKSAGKTNTYYFNKYGTMLKGWQKIKHSNGKTYTYYFKSNGVMQTGKATIGAKTYVFKSNGICTNP